MSARIFDLTLKPVVDGTEIIEISENGTGSFKTPLSAVVANYQLLSGKGAVNGYAGLDASQQLLIDNFPAGTALQVLRRNAANTALEFATISVSSGITSINADVTAAQLLVGEADKIIINDNGTGTHTFTVGTALDNSNISPTAAIAQSKLAALTALRATATDASGFIIASAVTSTELGFVGGVTSSIQTQLDSKAASIHQTTHQSGNSDALTGLLDANARLEVSKTAASVGTRRELNLIEGTNVTLTVTDNPGAERVDVTIASSGGAGGIASINGDTTSAQILAGTANRISLVDAGATHTFDIDSAYVGQASITTLGTISTGVWNGTAIAYADLNLTNSIVNADINTSAGISLSKLATVITATILGRTTAGTGEIESLTGTQATALLDSFGGTVKGLVPTGSGNDNTLYLDGTGNWTVPPGGSGGITTLNTLTSAVQTFTQQADKILINSAGSAHAFTLGTDVVTIDQANTYEDFAQTFPDNQLKISNPLDTFAYTIVAGAITAARDATLPVLAASDVFVFESHIQTLSGKTLTTPTIGDFTNATHDHQDAAGGGQLVATAALTATGTKDSTTFLRGDNTWDVPPGGSTTFGGLTDVTFTALATGGIVYKSAGDWINLNPGSNGDVLTLAAGIPSWAAPSGTGITSINGDTTAAQIIAGTTNRISLADAGATHTIDIDAAYVGQASITTLGTITTGVWNGTPVAYANLTLTNSIVNADVNTNAAISISKLETLTADVLIGRGNTSGIPIEIDATAGGLNINGSNQLVREALTGDVTAAEGANATVIAADAVTYAKIQNVVADNVFLGNNSGANSIVDELTGTQATALLDVFTPSLKGLVPAATGGLSTEYLSADGTFSVPAGGSSGSLTVVVKSTNQAYSDNSPLINDTELFVVLTPGEYQFEARIWASKTVTSNLNYTFEADGGTATGDFSNLGTWDSQESIDSTPLGTSERVNGIASTIRQWPVYGRIVVTATTTLRFVWAGAGVEPTGTVVYAGSSLTVKSTSSGGGGATDTEFPIPLVQEVPEGTVGYPDIHDLATASAHVSGMVLPDVTASTINLKTMHPIPDDLAGTPAARIEFVLMTKTAQTSNAVRLTVSSLAVADTENFDQAFAAETETSVTMPAATETMDVYSQDMTTDPVAGDTVLIKLARDPTDPSDLYTGDIQIISATLWIQRST